MHNGLLNPNAGTTQDLQCAHQMKDEGSVGNGSNRTARNGKCVLN